MASVILLIVVLSFSALLTGSFTGIFRAGNRSQDLYEAQKAIDRVSLSIPIDTDTNPLSISFEDSTIIHVDGKTITIGESEGLNVNIMTFLPKM